MGHRRAIYALVLAPVLSFAASNALAFDETRYPDWSGQWRVLGGNRWDPTKPAGLGQKPPLT